jgi:hypothetical protein
MATPCELRSYIELLCDYAYGLNSRRFLSSAALVWSPIPLGYSVFRILIEAPPPRIAASISIPSHLRTFLGVSLGPVTQSCAPGSFSVSESFATYSSTVLHRGPVY